MSGDTSSHAQSGTASELFARRYGRIVQLYFRCDVTVGWLPAIVSTTLHKPLVPVVIDIYLGSSSIKPTDIVMIIGGDGKVVGHSASNYTGLICTAVYLTT